LGDRELSHYVVPFFACGTSYKKNQSHSKILKVCVFINIFLLDNTRKHIHSDNGEDEKHEHNKRSNIGNGRQYHNQAINEHSQIFVGSNKSEDSHDPECFENLQEYDNIIILVALHAEFYNNLYICCQHNEEIKSIPSN
jgi:hypothetical protein